MVAVCCLLFVLCCLCFVCVVAVVCVLFVVAVVCCSARIFRNFSPAISHTEKLGGHLAMIKGKKRYYEQPFLETQANDRAYDAFGLHLHVGTKTRLKDSMAAQADWVELQTKIFLRWVNQRLAVQSMHIATLKVRRFYETCPAKTDHKRQQ
jgi:hypothetical protein